jgi:hypothetical protein
MNGWVGRKRMSKERGFVKGYKSKHGDRKTLSLIKKIKLR